MRALLGSVALSVGGFLLLAALLTGLQPPGSTVWVSVASGCLGLVLVVASFILLLRTKGGASGQRVIVVLSLVGGLAGLVYALASKNHSLGKYCGIEGLNQNYQLMVRIFGRVLHEESGPAVQRTEAGATVTGPSQELESKMMCWELGLDLALVAAGALLAGVLGLFIRLLTKPFGTANSAIVGAEPP